MILIYALHGCMLLYQTLCQHPTQLCSHAIYSCQPATYFFQHATFYVNKQYNYVILQDTYVKILLIQHVGIICIAWSGLKTENLF